MGPVQEEMTQCPFYYHTSTNAAPRRCMYQENHEGEHKEERLPDPQSQPFSFQIGWRRH